MRGARRVYRASVRALVDLSCKLGFNLARSRDYYSPLPVYSDNDLTALVNAAFLPRTESAELHDIAHQRAVEISTDFSHNGIRAGTAEVLAWNSGYADPIAEVLSGWAGSPTHIVKGLPIISTPRWAPSMGS